MIRSYDLFNLVDLGQAVAALVCDSDRLNFREYIVVAARFALGLTVTVLVCDPSEIQYQFVS